MTTVVSVYDRATLLLTWTTHLIPPSLPDKSNITWQMALLHLKIANGPFQVTPARDTVTKQAEEDDHHLLQVVSTER